MKYLFSILFIIGAFTSCIGGYHLGISLDPEWFARFGSLVVLFGVCSEYELYKIEKEKLFGQLKGQGASVFGGSGIPDLTHSSGHNLLSALSHFAVFVGTIVWGFGDKFLIWIGN
ncbi:hypothetical protein [Pseudoalteromonas sp. MMG022]|uniref:hypothetical protein n=1 Tax=Pseudoalteromonas sp. MMG022 TaxID=2909978 RepID=UPI001F358D45|nr:hypothetical protein [Pseudoalteromonas sp. MMG022]MCF6436245.1 hypothetical protein [Pseudoalteromonas sp. MMG022]